MNTVKYIAEIETPTEYTGYLVDGIYTVPFDERNTQYQQVQIWISEGNTVDDAYTQAELDDYAEGINIDIQNSMVSEGQILGVDNTSRTDVSATPSIEDQAAYDQWMLDLYTNKDSEPVQVTLFKPPETERQKLSIYDEDRDRYTFTRYHDQWGWRWYLELFRADVNALAIAIYDAQGNYLYTTGGLIDTGNGSWYTTCPAGQADATPQDVYYKWLLGSANISDLEVYSGGVQSKSGTVHSDPRYD